MATLFRRLSSGLLVLVALTAAARADNARFDLAGPKVDVRVTRAGTTLPIASVPNLQHGDRLWIHPDLPPTQSVHYLLVVAFLRGTTNPPPDSWFTRIETWDKKVRAEGVEVAVPDEAEQAVMFLAPVTGGDFSTLRSAVQGRPGIFVRASQDLILAGFEQGRIERYLAAMKQLPPDQAIDPKALVEHSNLIAATLALKPNADCAKLPPDQQYTCLTQTGTQTLLDDGHGQSIVAALSSGPGSDFINQASYTQLAGGGLYSAYVGAIVDLVRIMGSLHTAQYQYIPAIAFPQQAAMNLRLNVPPSFHNPKSVIVIGLPSIQPTSPPPLRPTDPKVVSCLEKPGVVLPVEGAPLVFSTSFAHDLVLHIAYPAGTPASLAKEQDIPLTADAYKGGLVLAPEPKRRELPPVNAASPETSPSTPAPASSAPAKSDFPGALTGTIKGFWGFDPFTGPAMPLQDTPGKDWRLAESEPIIAGKDKQVTIASTGTACIESIALDPPPNKPAAAAAKTEKVTWKQADKPDTVDVTLNLPGSDPGTLQLAIQQYGDSKLARVSLTAYSEPAKLSAFEYHAGDNVATLTGTSLDQVRSVSLGKLAFKPDQPASGGSSSTLNLTLPSTESVSQTHGGERLTAKVELVDGRTLSLPVVIAPPRPSVTLLSKASMPAPQPAAAAQQSSGLRIQLANPEDLPINQELTFSLKSEQPFPRTGQIEIASGDDSLRAVLSVASGSLVLQDPRTIVATLDPLKVFGNSAFGPLRLRAIAPDGTPGAWIPLTTLVRLPTLTSLTCPAAPSPTPRSRSRRGTPAANVTPAVTANALVATPVSASAPARADSPASPGTPPGAPATPDPAPADANAKSPDQAETASRTAPAPEASPAAAESPASQPPSSAPEQPAASAPAPAPCTLTGSNLYLVDAVAPTASFANPTQVPGGFVGTSLSVKPPAGPTYYLKLRDDPSAANTIVLSALP